MTGPRRAIGVLAAGEFTLTASLTTVVPFLPFHLAELGASPVTRQLWTGAALVAPAGALLIASPLWGRVGDRFGRRWMIVRSLAGVGVSLLAMGLVTTPAAFLACRLAQGALGGATDAAAAYLTAELAPEERGRALGRLHAATAAGAFAGPLAGGFLAAAYGYRAVFVSVAGGVLAAAVVAWLVLDEDAAPRARRERPAAFLGLPRLFRHPVTRACLLAGAATNIATYGLITVLAPQVQHIVGDTATATRWVGVLQAITWAAATVGASWWGRRNDARNPATSIRGGALGCAVAIGGQALAVPVGALVPLRLLQGVTASAVVPSVYLAASRLGAGGQEGSHVGTANSVLVGGQVAGGLLAGLVSSAAGIASTIALLAAVAGFGALAASIRSRTPKVVS